MSAANLGSVVAEEWEKITTLTRYGSKPLTVGWWRGRAFIHIWDYTRGAMTWREFKTTRAEQSPREQNIFESTRWLESAIWRAMR